MHLFNCLHPVSIKDKKGRTRYVPCGKCDYCRYIKSIDRTNRATNELRKHKYCLFVTLTYHDAFLPLVRYDDKNHLIYFLPQQDCEYNFADTTDGLCCHYVSNDNERMLLSNLTSCYGGVPVLNQVDVQKFLKRLRISIFRDKQLANKNKELYEKEFKIVYSYCGEYGPTTYRPHYHILFMFDSYELFKALPKMLHKMWKFGFISQRWVSTFTEDASYVARYANSVNRLPPFYQQKMVASFYRTSRTGSFGFVVCDENEIKRVYSRQSPVITVQDMLSKECKSVPLPLYVKNKLFPKFSGFDALNYHDIVGLLSTARTAPSLKDFERYLFYKHSLTNHSSLNDWLNVYLKGDNLAFHKELDDRRKLVNLAKSIYYASRAYLKVESAFKVTLSEAVLNTINFQYNYEHYNLMRQLEFEDSFYVEHPDWLFYIDSSPTSMSVMMSTEFGGFLSHMYQSIEHSHKNKRKNEYLAKNPQYSFIQRYDDERISFINSSIHI